MKSVENKKTLWEEYKSKRNAFVNLFKKNKCIYYEKKIDENKYNSKKMWKYLKDIYKAPPANFNFVTINFSIENDKTINVKDEKEAVN